MGYSRFSYQDWGTYSNTVQDQSASQIYTSSRINEALDPKNIAVRESRDSEHNPNSNAIIIGLDVTGSMANVLESIIQKGLGELFNGIYETKPVDDPHILFAAVGDVHAGDRAPLQITQFEADMVLVDQLTSVYFEQGGGGNMVESYPLVWYFAAMKTATDCFEKRGKKGYIFTVGDEGLPSSFSKAELEGVFGIDEPISEGLPTQTILEMASEKYNVYHVIVQQGFNYQRGSEAIEQSWRNMLTENVLLLDDVRKMDEIILATIRLNEGHTMEQVLEGRDESTCRSITSAVSP